MIRTLPLKFYVDLLENGEKDAYANKDISAIKTVRKTMRRLEGALPFKLSCLVKALTFKRLLGKLNMNSNIMLSLNKGMKNSLQAHAWVACTGEPVYLYDERICRTVVKLKK